MIKYVKRTKLYAFRMQNQILIQKLLYTNTFL